MMSTRDDPPNQYLPDAHVVQPRTERDNQNKAMLQSTPAQTYQIVCELLDHGANANARDMEGRTPLHYAASQANESVLLRLLHNRADVNAQPVWHHSIAYRCVE